MTEQYDLTADLAALVVAGMDWNTADAGVRAGRIGERLGLGEDDNAGTAAAELRKALGIPGPRSVTFDMADRETFAVLTAALEAFGAEQRDRAKAEGGNPQRTRWAAKAAQMLHDADTARNAEAGDGA